VLDQSAGGEGESIAGVEFIDESGGAPWIKAKIGERIVWGLSDGGPRYWLRRAAL
jgi:hypothetical protein